MAIIRGGKAEYKSPELSFDAKKVRLEQTIRNLMDSEQNSLNLSEQYLGLDEAKILANCQVLHSIRALNLSDNQINNEGLLSLLESPFLEKLEYLDLGINYLSDTGFKEIVLSESVKMNSLKTLLLNDNRLSDLSLETLVQAPVFSELEFLNLDYTQVGNGMAKALCESDNLMALKTLSFERGYLNDEGMKDFIRWPGLPGLENLNLSTNKLTSEGTVLLAECGKTQLLKALALSYNLIDDVGIEALGRSPHLTHLRELKVGRNPFTEKGAIFLKNSTTLTAMKVLILYEGADNTPDLMNFSKPELLAPRDQR